MKKIKLPYYYSSTGGMMKICPRCKEGKPLSEYYRSNTSHGIKAYCKLCSGIRVNEWKRGKRDKQKQLLIKEIKREAYEKGRKDMEAELTRNVLLDGEPRNYVGMDTPDGKLSKKYEELLTQQSLDKGDTDE